ncbi:hypothetical protein [Achromobacter kerstersii]|jgi:hypothetical protein|uniref:hypothetical protein n=1 Tax=Achromobacter kerstersii TaxID=1353890 RepID=UPI0012E14019|nr:hypothetical protein [Achromobacter kerstersii]
MENPFMNQWSFELRQGLAVDKPAGARWIIQKNRPIPGAGVHDGRAIKKAAPEKQGRLFGVADGVLSPPARRTA